MSFEMRAIPKEPYEPRIKKEEPVEKDKDEPNLAMTVFKAKLGIGIPGLLFYDN